MSKEVKRQKARTFLNLRGMSHPNALFTRLGSLAVTQWSKMKPTRRLLCSTWRPYPYPPPWHRSSIARSCRSASPRTKTTSWVSSARTRTDSKASCSSSRGQCPPPHTRFPLRNHGLLCSAPDVFAARRLPAISSSAAPPPAESLEAALVEKKRKKKFPRRHAVTRPPLRTRLPLIAMRKAPTATGIAPPARMTSAPPPYLWTKAIPRPYPPSRAAVTEVVRLDLGLRNQNMDPVLNRLLKSLLLPHSVRTTRL
jgi:hypothetical protein